MKTSAWKPILLTYLVGQLASIDVLWLCLSRADSGTAVGLFLAAEAVALIALWVIAVVVS